jgi:hypothetical protein
MVRYLLSQAVPSAHKSTQLCLAPERPFQISRQQYFVPLYTIIYYTMTQDQKNHFPSLRAAVEGLPSGSSLIASLESEEAPCLQHSLAELFAKVIDEARCRPGNAPRTTLEPVARVSLADATSVVRQLMFVVPR